jgi:hypothetical protein
LNWTNTTNKTDNLLKKQNENTSQNKKIMHSYSRMCNLSNLQFPEKEEESPLNNGCKYNMETPQLHNVNN